MKVQKKKIGKTMLSIGTNGDGKTWNSAAIVFSAIEGIFSRQ